MHIYNLQSINRQLTPNTQLLHIPCRFYRRVSPSCRVTVQARHYQCWFVPPSVVVAVGRGSSGLSLSDFCYCYSAATVNALPAATCQDVTMWLSSCCGLHNILYLCHLHASPTCDNIYSKIMAMVIKRPLDKMNGYGFVYLLMSSTLGGIKLVIALPISSHSRS